MVRTVCIPTRERGNEKTQPMGIAEYKLQQALPEVLESNLPSIEQIERELQGGQV